MSITVTIDEVEYRVTNRPDGILIYKTYKTGEYKGATYYRSSICWDSRKQATPKLNSIVARVLAAATKREDAQ